MRAPSAPFPEELILSCVLAAAGLGSADEFRAPLTLEPLTDGAAAVDMERVGGEGAAGQAGEKKEAPAPTGCGKRRMPNGQTSAAKGGGGEAVRGARDVVERAVGGWSEEVDQGEVARGWLCESEAPKPRVVWRSWQLYGCGG